MKCFYHDDLDGICSAAIVYKYYKENWPQFMKDNEFIKINYKDEFPFDKIQKDEKVIIVDFSIQTEGGFQKLFETTDNVIWIDHHKSAIEKNKDISIPGIRHTDHAGCVLTWRYFYNVKRLPKIVDMLGSYDIWDFTKYGNDINILQAGIKLYDYRFDASNWQLWLTDDISLNDILSKGIIALQYRTSVYESLISSWAFFAMFEGYKAVCCNNAGAGSQLFDSVKEEYDLMMPMVYDGNTWSVSIYSKRKDIDCSELAKKYGGGGHFSASGFQCKELPFKKII